MSRSSSSREDALHVAPDRRKRPRVERFASEGMPRVGAVPRRPRPKENTIEFVSLKRSTRMGGIRGRLFGSAAVFFALLVAAGVAAPSATAADPSEGYVLDVNGRSTTLTEGETITFSLRSASGDIQPHVVTPSAVYDGNAGTITVTASKGVYYWSVKAPCATSFLGTFSITDLTSGLGGGSVPASGFWGSAPTSKLFNHRYSGTLSGTASNPWVGPCAWTGPNNTIYKNQG